VTIRTLDRLERIAQRYRERIKSIEVSEVPERDSNFYHRIGTFATIVFTPSAYHGSEERMKSYRTAMIHLNRYLCLLEGHQEFKKAELHRREGMFGNLFSSPEDYINHVYKELKGGDEDGERGRSV